VSVLGCAEPRLLTPPLRELTPKTTLGYECIRFATEILGVELLPYQKWLLLHALELNPDGSFRFRTLLVLIARQNGKTTLVKVLIAWFLFMGRARLVLGAAQSLDIARETWQGVVEMAEDEPELRAEVATVRRTNGEQELRLHSGSRYRIAAATRGAGRGLSVDVLSLDELREHRGWEAWGALTKTTMARPNALVVCTSNAGDSESVVLNQLREAALDHRDSTLGIFEWSAPDGCDLEDVEAWAQANPALGHTVSEASIRSSLVSDPPAVFRTEVLCQRVDTMDSAVELPAWRDCRDPAATLAQRSGETVEEFEARRAELRIVACLDVAPDGEHVTLSVAALGDDGRIRVEPAAGWRDTLTARDELESVLDRIGAEAEAWFPSGPGAVFAPIMKRRKKATEIKGAEVSAACMGFADLVKSRKVLHPGDPLLDAHIAGAARLHVSDGWRFTRRGVGHADAAYSAAGAVYTVQMLPPRRHNWEGVVL